MPRGRPTRVLLAVIKTVVYTLVIVLVLGGVLLAALETQWGKDQLRELMVRQANQYLTATLDIERLEGSLVRGLTLRNVNLSRDGASLIAIDEVSVSYSIRELVEQGTTIRRLRLVRPRFDIAREADGRWNITSLVRREARREERTGPGRPIQILDLQIEDGQVSIRDPLSFGVARVPKRYEALNLALAFAYRPVEWTLTFSEASWRGGAEELTVHALEGTIQNGPTGWSFERLSVRTPRSAFRFSGGVDRAQSPSTLDIAVDAERFSFQEWAVVVPQLRNIAIDAGFKTRLRGPLTKLATELSLDSNGGSVAGTLVLNTRVPGWHGAGTLDVNRLNLASWLNRKDRPSDISGRVTFDLQFGPRFPQGRYTFNGPHAAYLGYEGDDVFARGTITASEALIAEATATAYGANVRIADGAIGIDRPYPYRFRGIARGVDLRRLPAEVPVPHVESTLAMEYDARGQFAQPFIAAAAVFEPSVFLGAAIGAGTVGSIDTSTPPTRYSGEGDISGIDLNAFGEALDVAWMRDPRYAGTVSGRFRVNGAGAEAGSMTLDGGGRLARATLFGGSLTDADVSIQIADGSLSGSYDGGFSEIDPALAFNDPRFAATLTGTGRTTVSVRELLLRTTTLADYGIQATVALGSSTIRGVDLESASTQMALRDGMLEVSTLQIASALAQGQGSGTIAFAESAESRFDYDVARLDLGLLDDVPELKDLAGRNLAGQLSTKGQLTGPAARLRLRGSLLGSGLTGAGLSALNTSADYDLAFPTADPAQAAAHLKGRLGFVEAFDQTIQAIEGSLDYDAGRIAVDVDVAVREGLAGNIAGMARLDTDAQTLTFSTLDLALFDTRWTLAGAGPPPILAWSDAGLSVTPVTFRDSASGAQTITVAGDWREDGAGALRVDVTGFSLDSVTGGGEQPSRYGGTLAAAAVISGTRDQPRVTSRIDVTEGRVRRLAYDRLAGRVDYANGGFDLDLRLDQAPGVWLTAAGNVPMSLFDTERPEASMEVAIRSSSIELGLIEGVTDVIKGVSGRLQMDVIAVGTSRDPHFTGTVAVANAGFTVTSTGSTYRNGRAALLLARDRIDVQTLHLEDRDGQPLDVRGTLGTHELTVGDVAVEVVARDFEMMRNVYGTIETDANLSISGRFEAPRIAGDMTIISGELNVDAILDRTLFRPYSTEAAPSPEVDAIAALNPWERLALDIDLQVPGTLTMRGDNVQVAAGTPIGLGDIDVRVIGDLFMFKEPGGPLSVTGGFDQMSGTYEFQGRRFDLEPGSSITFRGDLNPELFITVGREISGIQTRVTIVGPLREPELRLASIPPLDSTDILSLIVFNAPTNLLTGEQQRELAVRAGTLAAGFVAAPLISALERTLGLDVLQIEASSEAGNVARVTVGEEIAPGLIARFSRQFGENEYDEAVIEYYLSRLFRIRATFSDAAAVLRRYPFRRVERAGIDFLIFFSF